MRLTGLLFLMTFVWWGCIEAPQETPAPTEATATVPNTTAEAPEAVPVFVDAEAGKAWNIFGLEIVGKIMSAQTAGSYAVVMSTTPPAGGPPLHVHTQEDELFYVLRGTYEFRMGDDRLQADAGDLVHLPRGLPHGFRNIGETTGVLLNTITPGGFEAFFEEIDRLPKDQPLDREQVATIAARYGLRFLPDEG